MKKVQRSPQALLKELRSLSTLDMGSSSKPIRQKDISSSSSSSPVVKGRSSISPQGKKGPDSILEQRLALRLAQQRSSLKVDRPEEAERISRAQEQEPKGVELTRKPKRVGVAGEEKSKELGKSNELAGKPKKSALGKQPHPSPPAISPTISQPIEISEDPHARERAISSYLTKLQVLALGKAEQTLRCSTDIPASELVKLASMLKDLQLTVKWTRKLEQAILENASRLTPPGIGKMGLLSKLKLLAGGVQKEQRQDGRQSGLKQGKQVLQDLAVPSDQDQVAGA